MSYSVSCWKKKARALRRPLLDQASAALEGQSARLLARLEAPALMEQTRAKMQEAGQKAAQGRAANAEDAEGKGLAERVRGLEAALDAQAATLQGRQRNRSEEAWERARAQMSAGRLEAAEEA